MVVTPMMVNGMPVHLPIASTAENISPEPLQITLNGDRTLYVGTTVIRGEELASELARQRRIHDRPVIVRAEKSLPYGEVVNVLDACRTAGFTEVGLGTESLSFRAGAR
jgi:biopolymer transport protein TolR